MFWDLSWKLLNGPGWWLLQVLSFVLLRLIFNLLFNWFVLWRCFCKFLNRLWSLIFNTVSIWTLANNYFSDEFLRFSLGFWRVIDLLAQIWIRPWYLLLGLRRRHQQSRALFVGEFLVLRIKAITWVIAHWPVSGSIISNFHSATRSWISMEVTGDCFKLLLIPHLEPLGPIFFSGYMMLLLIEATADCFQISLQLMEGSLFVIQQLLHFERSQAVE